VGVLRGCVVSGCRLCSFHKFRDERLAVYQGLSDETTDLIAARDAAVAERDALMAELARERERRAAEEPEIASLGAECAELEVSIASLNQQQARMRADAADTKGALGSLKERASAAVEELEAVTKDIATASERVIADPESVKNLLADATTGLDDVKNSLSEADRRKREAVVKMEVVVAASKELHKCMTIMGEAAEELSRLSTARQTVKARTAELDSSKAELAEAEAELRQKLHEVDRLESRVRDFRPSGQRKREAAERALEGIEAELEAVVSAKEEALERAADMKGRCDAEHAKATEAENERDSIVASVTRSRRDLGTSVQRYHAKLFRELDPPSVASTTPATPPRAPLGEFSPTVSQVWSVKSSGSAMKGALTPASELARSALRGLDS
jgi:chromosome segregation ATPase